MTHIASRPTLRDSVVTERTEPQTGAEEMRLNSHLVQSILSDKDIEGEPLKMLKQNDAFWKVSTGKYSSPVQAIYMSHDHDSRV